MSTRDFRVMVNSHHKPFPVFLLQQFHTASALVLGDYINQINNVNPQGKICAMHLRLCIILVENLRNWFTIKINGILDFDVVT